MFKENYQIFIFFILMILMGSYWGCLYNQANDYMMYKTIDGITDTINSYFVAPRYIKKRYNIYTKDTIYLFYNSNKKFIIGIENDSLKFYTIKK